MGASDKMVEQSDKLKNLTEDAFLETQSNDVVNTKEIKMTNERNKKLQARKSAINKMLEDLLKRESEQREEVNKLDAELKNQESNFKKVQAKAVKTNTICKTDVVEGFGIPGLFSSGTKVVKTCHTEIKKAELQGVVDRTNKLRQNQLEVLLIKDALQKNMTALYGELAKSIKGLAHTAELGNDLARA